MCFMQSEISKKTKELVDNTNVNNREFSSLKTMSRNNNLPYMYSIQPLHHLYNRTKMNILIDHKVLFFRCFINWPIDQIILCTWHFIQDVWYLLNTIKHVAQQKLEPCILQGCHASHWAYTMTHPLPACLEENFKTQFIKSILEL